MTRLDSARETADKTKETLAPYAATAKDTALHLAGEAKQRMTPALEAIGPKVGETAERAWSGATNTARSARTQYDKHLAPQFGQAFSHLPPEAQQNALKAFHRAQEAALAARLSAAKMAGQTKATIGPKVAQAVEEARSTVVPVAQEAQIRGAAALTALQGHVTASEISDLAAKNAKKEQRNGWATGLAVAGTLAVGSGVIAWQWWRRQSNPEWLIEPPAVQDSPNSTHGGGSGPTGAHAAGSTSSSAAAGGTANGSPTGASGSPVNGSGPADQAGQPPTDSTTPKPGPTPPPPGKPGPGDDHPKPHDPRKPH
ncbi:hypothetical protein GCM10010495_09060 [Kitasatospora herbaricolor]|uniref:DUF5324 family protein n=1 Tax=Kitasatospora herbaricolor TaxID=68217 RepID=UPI00174D2B01|nr:DUF5324 family protein [Kitasatospora herbaricolor]MDQ0309657.1 hypothetical protein [Kitasatospora herbaricolor]GGV00429.1 hypothetical protein GCM10010495_09060 [Kitasatospora herbaricolor]